MKNRSEETKARDSARFKKFYYASPENRQYVIDKARKHRAKMHTWFKELKAKLKCKKCGEKHVACLEFHHKDPSNKIANVRRMLGDRKGKRAILNEIKKCIVLCANCHRKMHYSGTTSPEN